MSDIQLEEKIARVSDILEQISKLNEMIDFHQNHSEDKSMLSQYQEMKDEFVGELEELLSNFKIKAKISGKAA